VAVQEMLPQSMTVSDVFAGTLGLSAARQQLIAGINSGQLLVNYEGHGSVQVWANNLFDDTVASSLTNGNKLPVFAIMNCLNGFFHDVFAQSLAESLMLAPNGGAVAVWASSGLTEPDPQFQMDSAFVRILFAQPSITLGDAISAAKAGIGDSDVRRTFVLFGDPTMRLKQPQALAPVSPTPPTMPDREREPERNLREPNRREMN
jgi:Peptidase family C25